MKVGRQQEQITKTAADETTAETSSLNTSQTESVHAVLRIRHGGVIGFHPIIGSFGIVAQVKLWAGRAVT
jgi:hypothetical protein